MGNDTTIIAECGINFNGDICKAIEMIWQAKSAGADIAKFQVYIPERILPLDHPLIKKWWDVIKATELTEKQVGILAATCKEAGIEFMASVFHPDRVPWLEAVGVKRYKIASRSIYNEPLARAVVATGKPILLSHGMYEPKRFPPLYSLAAPDQLSNLYCISEYPTPLEKIDISKMMFYDGFSDHTVGITASCVAITLGLKYVEKHFTLDRELPGPDHVCSVEPDELRRLCQFRDDFAEME